MSRTESPLFRHFRYGKICRLVSLYLLSYYDGRNSPPPSAAKPMTREEEAAAFLRYRKRKTMKDREALVHHYLDWAFSMAAKYKGPRLPFDDAIGAANEGLMEALDGYKTELGYRFTTYAAFVVRRKLIAAILSTYPVRVTDHTLKKIKAASLLSPEEQAKSMLADEPKSVDEFFERLGDNSNPNISLLHSRDEDSPFVPCPGEIPSEALELSDRSAAVRQALERLDNRSRQIVTARYFRRTPASFVTLGKQFKISKFRAREICEKALATLKKELSKEVR